MGGPRLDLHVHSRYSPDSRLTLEEIAARLPSVGLDGFALTDHNTVAGHGELAALATQFPALLLVPGVEVSTVEGHLLAYGVHEVPPLHRPVTETIAWVHEHGGVTVLSHPFRSSHGVGRKVAESAPVTAIETVNGHNSFRANARAAAVAARRRLAVTGGSDVHELADVGRAYTEFPDGTKSGEDALRALREGRQAAGGHGLSFAEWLRYEVHTALARVRRGFRPI
jgi:predicted metal-dependent phosphoesterase TrpH